MTYRRLYLLVNSWRTSKFYQPFILGKPLTFVLIPSILLGLGIGVQILQFVINDSWNGILVYTNSTNNDSGSILSLTSVKHLWRPAVAGVIISTIISWVSSSVDFALKKTEPYRQLAKRQAPAESSLLLNYTETPNIFVWLRIFRNSHWTVLFSTIACLLSLSLSPLSSTLFIRQSTVANSDWTGIFLDATPGMTPGWEDLTSAYTAANSLSSIFLDNSAFPRFVTKDWAFPSFVLGVMGGAGGSSNEANTTGDVPGIRSFANCEDTKVQWISSSNGTDGITVTITGIRSGNSVNISDPSFTSGTTHFDIISLPSDSQDTPPSRPILFYAFISESPNFFSYQNLTTIICNPSAFLQNATITVDIHLRILSAVAIPNEQPRKLPFLNGSLGLNGYFFNPSSDQDPLIEARRRAIKLSLTSTLYEIIRRGFAGEIAWSQPLFDTLQEVYQTYLSLFAWNTYFIFIPIDSQRDDNGLPGTTVYWVDKLFVSTISASLISTLLVIMACLLFIAAFLHHRIYPLVSLRQDPSSIAGIMTTLVDSNLIDIARGFSKDPGKMKEIIMEHNWSLVDGEIYAEGPQAIEKDIYITRQLD